MIAIHFDQKDDAEELIGQLHAAGYSTTFTREAFAGDDDDEDQAWVLTVEPFDDHVVEMVDVYGGWLPGDERLPRDVLDLPDEPNRA